MNRFGQKTSQDWSEYWRKKRQGNTRNDTRKPLKKEKEKKSEFVPVEDRYKQIGSRDGFNDSSTTASYNWASKTYPAELSKHHEITKGLSLKKLCAMTVAENAHGLTVRHLQSIQWKTMKEVWYYICRWRRDNFIIFQLFASVFHNEADFQAHPAYDHLPLPKKEAVLKTTLPTATRHRVERLFANINIPQLVHSLNSCQFRNLTILEISKPLTTEDLLQLTNLNTLTALRLTHTTLPDHIIPRWCTSLKSGKWAHLQCLSLPCTTQENFNRLQDAATYSKLMYIELHSKTVFNISKWDMDTHFWDVCHESLEKLPWGLKSQVVMKKYKLEDHSEGVVWLDLNVMDTVMSMKGDVFEFDKLWKAGEVIGYTQAMVLKKRPSVRRVEVPVGEVRRSVKKPVLKKRKIGDIKSFFDL